MNSIDITQKSSTQASSTQSSSTQREKEAFDSIRDRLDALPVGALVTVNADIVSAITTVRGAGEKLRKVPVPDGCVIPWVCPESFDDLARLTDALDYAHGVYLAVSEPAPIDALVAEITEARALLVADATTLARHGLIDGKRLSELKGPVGYHNLYEDTRMLVQLLLANEPVVLANSAIKPGYLVQVSDRLRALDVALGIREQMPLVAGKAADDRERAFTLFLHAYDEMRRAVSFIRWHEDDVDQVVPSIYAGKRRKSATEPAAPPAPAAATTTEPAATTAQPVVTAPAAPTPASALLGGNPFTS